MPDTVDLLAIAAHRDDVELTCGGTLAKAVKAGHRVGILDLTEGESGTRGDASTRAAEAERAARALGVHLRLNAGLPDAHLAYDEDPVKPSFVVDISDTFDTKMAAIRCYTSQFDGAKAAGEIHPTGQDLYELIRVQSAHYGALIRRRYGEPFYTAETQEVDDVLKLGVQSI